MTCSIGGFSLVRKMVYAKALAVLRAIRFGMGAPFLRNVRSIRPEFASNSTIPS